MPARELPGFYFDEAKRKYFKIQANHVAPTGSNYSKESVQREVEAKKDAMNERRRKRVLESGQIQRSRILNHPLGGGMCLQTATKLQPTPGGPDSKYAPWARSLHRKTQVREGVDRFCCDSAVDTIYFTPSSDPNGIHANIRLNHSKYERSVSTARADSPIVSLTLSRSRVLMATAIGNGGINGTTSHSSPASLHMIRLTNTENFRNYLEYPDNDPASLSLSDLTESFNFPNKTFWASSAKPDATSAEFAVACGHGVVHVLPHQSSWHGDYHFFTEHSSDLLAVDWQDDKILVCGYRDRKIVLYDTRSSGRASRSTPIWAPSSVSHVRAMDRNRIVVAGLANKLSIYDLRYLKSSPTPELDVYHSSHTPTLPLLKIPAYRNHSNPGYTIGFDVHPSSDLIAASQDRKYPPLTQGGGVQVFDAGTGKELAVGAKGRIGPRHTAGSGIKTGVQFLEREGEKLSLMVASGDGLEEWCW